LLSLSVLIIPFLRFSLMLSVADVVSAFGYEHGVLLCCVLVRLYEHAGCTLLEYCTLCAEKTHIRQQEC